VQAFHDAFQRIGMDPAVACAIKVGTVEDFCTARLSRLEGLRVERLTQPEQVREHVLQAVADGRQWAEDRYPGEFALSGSGHFAVEGLLQAFARIKGSMAILRAGEHFTGSPDEAAEVGHDFTTLAIYRAHERRRCHTVGADGEQVRFRYVGDATYDLARLLTSDDPPFSWETHPLRLGLQAVVLDEMHDTHWAMFTVVQALLALNADASFLGVGDRDQVIHAQEGADAWFMREGFDLHIGTAQRLPLSESYRFGEAIARPLSGLAHKPYPANAQLTSQVDIKRADTAVDLFALIHNALTSRRGLDPASPARQLAVILHEPSTAVELEHVLQARSLPYETVGFTTFLERPEVLFVRILLMAAVSLPEQFRASVLQQAKFAAWAFIGGELPHDPTRGDSTEKAIAGASQNNFVAFTLPGLLQHTPHRQVREAVRQAMALASADDVAALPQVFAALDIPTLARRVLVNQAAIVATQASLDGLLRVAREYNSLSAFLRSMLSHDHARLAPSPKTAAQRITLTTVEDAKGLEFDHVIIPGMNHGAFDGSSDDERNRFYVAASRAKHLLTFTHTGAEASRFLRHFA
jgi:DNA helicase-2/ATP-dependent DNA helicase PcrA